MIVLSPSIHSFPPAEAIRSSHSLSNFRTAPTFLNTEHCPRVRSRFRSVCDRGLVHVAITLDSEYLRGSIAAVHSILHHSTCPEDIYFHFLVSVSDLKSLESLVREIFPVLNFRVYFFDSERVRNLISTSVRQALEQPLNYARNYLPEMLPPCVSRVIYLDSDIVLVDDILKLWRTRLAGKTIGAPEYCHANFTKYFTAQFWSDPHFSKVFENRNPCYFNTGVMVVDLVRWRQVGYTGRIEKWMEVQRRERIYELGSLPPFLLVFAGHVAGIKHRWNQHGLGGDNVRGSCRDLHSGPVSLLHWSGSGKPWIRIDEKKPCPLDSLWAPYDLYRNLEGQ